jgi:hypothetical protein
LTRLGVPMECCSTNSRSKENTESAAVSLVARYEKPTSRIV